MEPLTIGILGVAVMVSLLLCGMSVGLTMALVGYVGIILVAGLTAANALAATVPYGIISDYNFCVLPLFILMANICFYTEFGHDLFDLTYKWVGRLPGGLAAATIGTCALFGAVCASVIATSMTVGLVAMPEMRRYKYDSALAGACVACGGILGILIPPSSVLIIYGIMTEQSIGELFIAGIVPGIVLAIMFMLMVFVRARINPVLAPAGPSFTIREKVRALAKCTEMFLLILLSIVGLIVGWFSPTEAGGIGALGAMVLSLFRKRLTWAAFKKACVETVLSTAMIYLMLIGAMVLNSFLTLSTLPMELADMVSGLNLPPFAVILMIVLLYLILGCFVDAMALVLLTIPAFYPVVTALGYDPIWFGVLIVVVMGMATISPPVGMNVYVIAGIARDVPMAKLFRATGPFLLIELLFVLLLMGVPQIALWLPRLALY
jgi:C4-dicarboxylate transporter DctM subunit